MAKTCPQCLLVNPESAQRCDCGFPLIGISPEVLETELAATERNAAGKALAFGLLGVGAIAFAVVQFVHSEGGPIVIPYGAAIFGLVVAGRAFVKYLDARLARRENLRRD